MGVDDVEIEAAGDGWGSDDDIKPEGGDDDIEDEGKKIVIIFLSSNLNINYDNRRWMGSGR